MLTTEQILTHPSAFGLVSATPSQRALCRILDGLPLAELASCEDVREAIGDVDAVGTVQPFEVHALASIRSAKSLIAAAHIVRSTQSVNVDHLGHGDILKHVVVSLKLENTRAVMNHLAGNVNAKPILRQLAIGEPTSESVVLRHPSGRAIEVTPTPLDRAGGSATSFWLTGITIDEEPRMMGATDGVKNWDHLRDAVMGRLLPGAQLFGIGSPWAPFGPVYDLVQDHWGKPTRDVVIFRGRGPAMNPTWWTPERCDDLRRRNPTAYRTDVLCEFTDQESSLLSSAEIDAVTRKAPAILPPAAGVHVAAMDPATRGNSWALAIARVEAVGQTTRFRIALVQQWTGSKVAPLSPERVLAEIGKVCRAYGVTSVATDQYSVDAIRDLARRAGLSLVEHTVDAAKKLELYEGLHTLIASEQVELPPDPVVRADLLSVKKRVTQTGLTIALPTSRDGRHADTASALALCVWLARQRAGIAAGSYAKAIEGFRSPPPRFASPIGGSMNAGHTAFHFTVQSRNQQRPRRSGF